MFQDEVLRDFLLGILAVLILVCLYWISWQIWLFALPVFCYGCPETVIDPGFLEFVAGMFVLKLLGTALFRR